MATLTPKQKILFNYIEEYIRKNGFSPSYEDMRKKLKLSSLSSVHDYIESLIKKEFIEKSGNSARSIELKNNNPMIEIPISGFIAAGQPIDVIDISDAGEKISIPRNELGKFGDYYALRVQGDSMMDEGIFDGDIVIIKKQSVAENGQTVVAIIDDNQATLKKLYREKNQFRLQPRNQNILPIYRKEVEIRGVVAKIISNFNNEFTNKGLKTFRTLDLFAGIGGIRKGFEKAGFETVFANDFDEACKQTYDMNFKTSKLVVEDIKKLGLNDLPEFNFLLAGFPCQAFSIAGYRQGFKDEKGRGNLFFEIARIIEDRRPEGFLLENVKNLKGHDEGKTFKVIIETLEGLGYKIKHQILNSMEYGNIPQNRERIYIVGFKNEEYAERFEFPEKKNLTLTIADLLESNPDKKYYYNGKPLYQKIKDDIKKEGRVYQWRRKYVRENKKGVCPTLTANMGTGGHNVPIIKDKKGIRKLTPLECFRIQGFPKSFSLPKTLSDSALYKQAGNSVSVTVVEAIAKKIREAVSI
jgi:DNA (cytosine-5)-methyltransferase 1